MPPGIHPPAGVVPGLSRRGDAGRPGADTDVPTARADAAEAQGRRFRRHFVSHDSFRGCVRAVSPRNLSRADGRALFPPRRARVSHPPARGAAFPRELLPARKRLSAYLIIII